MLFDLAENLHRSRSINQVDGDARFTEAPRSTDAVEVGLAISSPTLIDRKVEIHNHGDLFDVDTARHDVRRDEHLLFAFAETVDDVYPLIDLQLSAKEGDGVPFSAHRFSQP